MVTGLTPTQIRVLELAATGLRNAAIADHLGLQPSTVETQMSNIYLRLGIDPLLDQRVSAVVQYLASEHG